MEEHKSVRKGDKTKYLCGGVGCSFEGKAHEHLLDLRSDFSVMTSASGRFAVSDI